nr:hypothetical protein [uncultured Eisenbergiella sp.]
MEVYWFLGAFFSWKQGKKGYFYTKKGEIPVSYSAFVLENYWGSSFSRLSVDGNGRIRGCFRQRIFYGIWQEHGWMQPKKEGVRQEQAGP